MRPSIKQVMRRLLQGSGFALGCTAMSATAWAGNVQVALEGSLLKIQGSSTADTISVVQTAVGDIFVTAGTATTINGRPSLTLRRVALNAVDLRLEGGNDVLTMRGLNVNNDFFINLGAGNDRVATSGAITVGDNLSIEGEAGADNIRLVDATVGVDTYINGGLGSLNAEISGLQGGMSLTVISDEASDIVSISETVVFDGISIETKNGNDRVTISGAMARGLGIDVDLGNDVVQVTDVMADEDVGIFTGPGTDVVSLANLVANKNINVNVDIGDDRVSGQAVSAGGDAVFIGGNGTDSLNDLGITGGSKKEIKEFENVTP